MQTCGRCFLSFFVRDFFDFRENSLPRLGRRKKKKKTSLNCDLADGLREGFRDRREVLRDGIGQRDAVRIDKGADGELVHV